MHVAIALFLAIVVSALLVGVFSASPAFAIPILALFLVIPIVYGRLARRVSSSEVEKGDTPSSDEASYTPVIDPSDR